MNALRSLSTNNQQPAAMNPARTDATGTAQMQRSGAAAIVPFPRAAREHTEQGPTLSGTLASANQVVSFPVPVYGWMERLDLRCVVSSAGNAAAVAAAADAPWTLFRNIIVKDANGTQIYNLSGYSLYLAMKYGGYSLYGFDDTANSYGYTPMVTGAVATGGTFAFTLPLSFVFGRDLGFLSNMDGGAPYRIELTIGSLAEIYSVSPTVAPTFTIQPFLYARTQPAATDLLGNVNQLEPHAKGTMQFLRSSIYALAAGDNTVQLLGVGNLIRNHILVFRTAAGVRSETVVPTTAYTLLMNGEVVYYELPVTRRGRNYELMGNAEPAGVLRWPRFADPDNVPGSEFGDRWLPTLGNTSLILRLSAPVAGSLEVITNDIVPVGDVFYAAQMIVTN